jgi:hypothetical protein
MACLLAIITLLTGVHQCLATPALSTLAPSYNDLWDVSQVSVVTSHSGALDWGYPFISNPNHAFGATTPGVREDSVLIFGDHPQGFVHFVEWKTPKPIRLESFMLQTGHDGHGGDMNYRGFSRFSLFAEGVKLFDFFPANPIADSAAPVGAIIETVGDNVILMLANVTPTTAQHFRAEMVQFGNIFHALGPRIIELDGFGSVVPEPASAMLAILGCMFIAVATIRRTG